MKLKSIKEAFTLNKNKTAKNSKYEIIGAGPEGEDELDLDTINASGIKLVHNKKTGRKMWMKERYSDLEDERIGMPYSQIKGLDFIHQDERGFIEYVSYNLLRYLKKYCPEIRIPNHIRLSFSNEDGFNATYQTLTSSYRNLKQASETTKGNVYRNLVIDTYLFLILIGHTDFHKGNLIVKNKNDYYMIDPEISLQNYERAIKMGRDFMEFSIEPYFKYNASFKKIVEQYNTIMKINIDTEFGPIIDKCIEIAIKAMIKDGMVDLEDVKEERRNLKSMKNIILRNIHANKKYIKEKFKRYVDAENAVSVSSKPIPLLRKT